MSDTTHPQMEDDESGGDLRQIAGAVGVVIIAAAARSQIPLPQPPRIAKLGRELRGEALQPVQVWQNPTPRGGNGPRP